VAVAEAQQLTDVFIWIEIFGYTACRTGAAST
jgi:hypothetical protein